MALTFNLHQLERDSLRLDGDLPAEELDLDTKDEAIRITQPFHYELELQQMEDAVLVQGTLALELDCECVRCLKPFRMPFTLEHWACHIPLEGEDKADVVNDSVDLTPYLREDIFLAFPQHPVCKSDCSGLAAPKPDMGRKVEPPEPGASPWAALDKLKLDN
ncbi:MAG: hypothetical protein QOF48_3311 [Verrucomicrobiota bacterium]|jgi:uncharacterized protein